ncbi:unnamed protein product [Closterium sp. Naga37s-1]|nr:unnamed protein product [Closterium sp. Naga37s-1]
MPTRRKSHAILLLRSAFLLQLTFSLVAFAASPATFPPQPSRHRATVSVARPDGRDGETEEGGESGEGGEGWDGETDWDEDPWRNQRVSPSPMLHDHATSVRRALAAGDPGDSQSSADGMSAALGAAGRGGLGRHRSREVRRLEQPITRSQLALLSLNFFPEVSGVDVITDDEGGDEGGKKRREQVALPNLGVSAGDTSAASAISSPSDPQAAALSLASNASSSAAAILAPSTASATSSSPSISKDEFLAHAASSATAVATPSASETPMRRRLVEEQGRGEGFLRHLQDSSTAAVATPSVPETSTRRRLAGEKSTGEGLQGSGGLSGAVRLKCPPISSQQITPGMVLLPNCSLAIASPEDGLKAWEGRNGEGKQGPGEEGEEEGDRAEEEEVEEVGGEGEGKGVRYGGGRGWAGRVVELRGVWVDGQGRVFNASHLFWPGGCGRRRALSEWLHVMAPHYLGAPPHQVTLLPQPDKPTHLLFVQRLIQHCTRPSPAPLSSPPLPHPFPPSPFPLPSPLTTLYTQPCFQHSTRPSPALLSSLQIILYLPFLSPQFSPFPLPPALLPALQPPLPLAPLLSSKHTPSPVSLSSAPRFPSHSPLPSQPPPSLASSTATAPPLLSSPLFAHITSSLLKAFPSSMPTGRSAADRLR